jgi:HEPN domain-containing protein
MDEVKRELVRDWLLKASRDLTVAKILMESPEAIWEAALYHCQQAAEKALKGFLVHWDVPIGRTHNLVRLLQMACQNEPSFDRWEDAAARLTPYSTAYRYPGTSEWPDLEQVNEAFDDAACIVNQAISFLPPEVHPQPTVTHNGPSPGNEPEPQPES